MKKEKKEKKLALPLHRSFNSSITRYFIRHMFNNWFGFQRNLTQWQHSEFESLFLAKKKPYLLKVTIIVFIKNLLDGLNIYIKHVVVFVGITREQFRKVHVSIRHHNNTTKNRNPKRSFLSWYTSAETKTLAPNSEPLHRIASRRNQRVCEEPTKIAESAMVYEFLRFFEGSTFRPNLESKKPEANQKD